MTNIELKDLVGEHLFRFTPKTDLRHPIDADAGGVMFGLDDVVYLIFEDPSDGYRSHAGPILAFKGDAYQLGGSYHEYIHDQRVICSHETKGQYGDAADMLCVRSAKTGEVIFRVGTNNVDDYYPYFVVEWFPQALDANQAAQTQQPSG